MRPNILLLLLLAAGLLLMGAAPPNLSAQLSADNLGSNSGLLGGSSKGNNSVSDALDDPDSQLGVGQGPVVGGQAGDSEGATPNDLAINALLSHDATLVTGGSVVYSGQDGTIRTGPFLITPPGLPPVTTSDELLMITLTNTESGIDEDFLLERPPTLTKGKKVPMLVAFHKCCNSELDIDVFTSFPAEARARGWFMMAPLGAFQPNFASVVSQQNTKEAIDFVLKRFGSYINRNRLYGVGFSMGGGSALSYAARHVDPAEAMFAAVVNHTGTLDLPDTFFESTAPTRTVLNFLFGGTPAAQPFNYRRSSLVIGDDSMLGFKPEASMGRNLTHVPILDVRAEFDHPDTDYLLDQNELFETMMSYFGGIVTVDIKAGVSVHAWSTLVESEALDFLEQFRLELPTSGQSVADREDRFFHFYIFQRTSGSFSPFTWEINKRANQIKFSETSNIAEIHFDPEEAGLTLREALEVWTDTASGLRNWIALEGFSFPPVEVLRDGSVTTAWVHDFATSTLTLQETDGTANHIWHVTSRFAASDVSLSMFVDEAAPIEGDSVNFTLIARNIGPSIATGITVDDVLPAGLTYVSSVADQGTYNDSTGVWDVGLLQASDFATLTLVASVDVGTAGQMIMNTASKAGLSQVDLELTNDTAALALNIDNDADLEVAKSVDNDRPKEGEQVVYTISVTNLASGAQASTLTISDSLPSGVTYVSDVASHGTYSDGTGIWTLGTLNTGATATLDITGQVDVSTLAQTIVNTASVLSFDQNDPNGTNDSDSASLLVVDDVDLSVTVVVDESDPAEQDQVVYTITVTNTSGSVAASSVELTDLLPAGVTYVSDTPSQGSFASGTGLWQVGSLGTNANATLAITAQVDVGTGGLAIVNFANGLTADQPDPNASNDSDSVQIDVDPDADLSVTKVVDDAVPIEQGQVVYTITVANPGGGAQATTVALTDLLPAGVTYVSEVASQGSYVSGTGLWTIGTIDAGNNATLDITASVDLGTGGAAIVNTASALTADQPDPNAPNDSDTAQIDVSDLADISVTKSVDTGIPFELDNVVYTITVSNPIGGAQATNLTVTDLLPTGVAYVSDVPSQGSYVSGTGVWTIGTLASGSMVTLAVTANVDVSTVGMTIVNSVAGLSLDQTDPNATNDTDMASFLVVDDVDLSVTKIVDDATPAELGTVIYTVTVANTSGTVAASSVSLTDLLPSGVTYVSDTPSQGSYVSGTGVWTVGSIAASSNATLDITASVDVATGGSMIVNTANGLSADQPDPNGANDSDTAQLDVDNDSDLAVSKIVDDAVPSEQDTIVYTITVSNPLGAAQATGISLVDVLPAGVTYVSDVPSQGSYVDGSGLWTVGTIDANNQATLAITATVDIGTGGDAIVNSTSGLALDQTDSNATNDIGTIQIDVDDDAELQVTKVVDDANPAEQGTVVYTITITNPPGSAQATTVALTDLLPAGVSYVSDIASQGSYVDGAGLWTVGTIDGNANATLDITATVNEGTGGSMIVNTANTLSADQPDSNGANNSDTATITVSNEADLSVTKIVDVPAPLESGTIVYTLTVANPTGAAQATGLTLTDLLPAGVTYMSDLPSQGSYNDVSGLWTVGTIDANANATLAITATVDVGTGGQAIVNSTSALVLDQTDPNATNDFDSAQIDVDDEADLSVTKVVDVATPLEGGTVVYTVSLENTSGGAQATSVTLTDLLPSGVTYISDTPSQGSYVSGTGLWTVGTLDTGVTATLDITATVDVLTGGTMIVNTASTPTLDQTDGNAVNDSDTASITVDNAADLGVAKIVDDTTPLVGGTIVYTITVDNAGGRAAATTVSLTDNLPAGVTYVSDAPSQGSYDDGSGVWMVGTVLSGSNATLDITATVDAATSGSSIVNSISTLGSDQTDSNAANDTDSAQIDVEPDIDLSVDKIVDDATPAEQDTIVYTVTVTNNNGVDAATGIELTDLLPAGVTYVSDVPSQGSYVDGTGIWTVGMIAASSNATLAITATADVATGGSAIVNTTSGLAFDQFDSNSANDVGSVQIDVSDDADLAVTKVVDVGAPLEAGTIVYTIAVANPVGAAQATTVSLTDVLPAGVTYVSDVPSQGSYNDVSGLWTIGTIDANANAILAITATVDVGTGGDMITNTTSALALDQTDPNAGNDSDSASITVDDEADLSVMKTVDDSTPEVTDTVAYTVTVSNLSGGAQATTVSITDLLPSGVTYVSDTPSQGSYVSGTGVWTVGTINAGANATLAITATVDSGQAGNQITNTTSSLTLDQTDSNAGNDVGSVNIDVVPDIDLSVAKVVDDATPNEQDTIVYTITVTNNDASEGATGISLTDVLPAGVTYVSDNPSQGSFASGSGIWTVGSIAALGTATLDLTCTVDAATGGDAIVNTTSALAFDQTDTNAANDVGSVQIDVDNGADLAVSKVVDVASPEVTDTIVYTITVSNPGEGAQATTVSITDLLPSGVTYVSDTPSQGSYVNGTGVWTVGTINASANATLAITATVDSGQAGNQITNTTSSLTLDQTDSNAGNDVGSVNIDVVPDIDLSVAKVVDDATPNEQDTIVYTITVTNNDASEGATGISLTDVLPAGVTYVSDNPSQGSFASGSGIWTVGSIAALGTATLDLTCTVDAATGGDAIVNTTSALAFDQTDTNAANDVGSVQIDVDNGADLAVSKVVDVASPEVTDTIVYTITVSNPGEGAQATTVSITDLLPSGVTYVSDTPSQGSYVNGTGVWTVGTINASANATLAITATVDSGQAGNQITNTTSSLTLDQTDSNAGNDVGSVNIDVVPDIDLSVAKVVDDATPNEQDTIVYTITVTNNDASEGATGISLTDVLPAGVTYVSDNPSQGSFASGSGIWTVGSIAALGTATLDLTCTVDAATGGDAIVNTTSALAFDQTDTNAANDVGSVQIDVDNGADLAVSKVVDVASPEVTDTIVYTITVSNPGEGAQATTVSITDLLPSGVTYVSDTPSQGSYVNGTGVWTVGTINASANATLAITATVDSGQAGNQITNTTSSLTLDQTDSNAGNDVGSVNIDVVPDIDLSVAKVVDDATPNEQDTIVYTITITNNDASEGATGISLTDVLPAGVTYVSDNPSQGSFANGSGIWTVGSISALGTATLDLTCTVDAATGGDAIVNTTSALAFDQTDTNAANDVGSVQIDVDNGADLAVSKVVDVATPEVTDTIVYTITVSNPGGEAQATTVSITDLLPSGVTYVSDTPSQGSYVNGTGVWTVGTINASANATLAITATVDSGQAGNQITNTTSSLTLDQTDSNAGNDVGSVNIDVVPDIDLSVAKVVDDATPNEQDTIVYTITVTNNDASEGATGISLTDVLPAGVTYVSDNPSQGSFASGSGIWTVGSISALGTATLDLTCTVDAATGGDAIVNTTSVLAFDQTDTNAANDVGSVQIDVDDGADLSVMKTVDDSTPDEAQSVVYTITVSNPSGGAQATNVSLSDVLPTVVTYSSDTPSQGSYVSGTGVWTVGTINAGSNATLAITVTVDGGTSASMITNSTSSLALDQTDSNATNDTGSVTVTVN